MRSIPPALRRKIVRGGARSSIERWTSPRCSSDAIMRSPDDSGTPAPVARSLALSTRPLAPASIRRSEEHTSELQSLMRISYAVFCLKKNTTTNNTEDHTYQEFNSVRLSLVGKQIHVTAKIHIPEQSS